MKLMLRFSAFCVLFAFSLLHQNQLYASTTYNVYDGNAKIENFILNKQYAEAISFCNKELSKDSSQKLSRFYLINKMRLFLKQKQSLDSVPVLYYKQKSLKSSVDSLDVFLNARSFEIFGHYNFVKGDKTKAIKNLHRADSLYNYTTSYVYRVYNLDMLGTMYKLNYNLPDAYTVLKKAKAYLIKYIPNDSSLFIDVNNDLGIVAISLEKHEEALTYYSSITSYKLSVKQKVQILNNLGIIYIEKQDYKKSLEHLNFALTVSENIDGIFNKYYAQIYNNIATAYEQLKKPTDSVLYFYDKSLHLKKIMNDTAGIVISCFNMANYAFNSGNFKEAEQRLNEALKLKKHFLYKDLANTYLILYYISQNKKEYEKSIEYLQLHYNYNDTIKQLENASKISMVQASIAMEANENLIKLLEKEQKIIEVENSKKEVIIISLSIIGFVFTLVLAFLANYFYKRQRMENRIRNRDVRLASVSSLLKGQEEERQRISKELHDSVGSNLAIINAQILKSISGDNANYLTSLISKTSEEIRNISHDLMPSTINKFGLIEALSDLKERWNATSKLIIDVNFTPTDIKLNPTVELTLYRILQELLKNSVTHGCADYALINITKNNEELKLIYEDNGTGFCYKESKNKGLGFSNIENRVSYLHGEMKIIEQEKGVKIIFTFRQQHNENSNR